jgi:hypothetical protein
MTTIARHRLRIAPDIKIHTAATDLVAGTTPLIWRGTDVQIEVGLFYAGVLQTDISNIASLHLQIFDGSRTGNALVTKTILAAELIGTLTAENWTSGTADKYHALFTLAYADTQLPLDGNGTTQQKKTFWAVIHAVTTDATARRLTWGGFNLEVEEDSAQNDLDVVPLAAPTFRISTGDLQLYNKTTGKFHAIWFEGLEGAETIKYGAGQS